MLPEIDETGVLITVTLAISFTEPLNESTIDDQSLLLTDQGVPVSGVVTYDAVGNRLSFAPSSPLNTETVHGITVAGTLEDMAGNAFLGQSWFFTTGDSFNLGGTSQITINQCMVDGDKLLLTLVNNARALSRSCGAQQASPQAPLAWNCLLEQAALGHSTSMADNHFQEHISPIDGSDPGDRVSAAGYSPRARGGEHCSGLSG